MNFNFRSVEQSLVSTSSTRWEFTFVGVMTFNRGISRALHHSRLPLSRTCRAPEVQRNPLRVVPLGECVTLHDTRSRIHNALRNCDFSRNSRLDARDPPSIQGAPPRIASKLGNGRGRLLDSRPR